MKRTGCQCECSKESHAGRFIVLTGGPGAGKTAVLELVRRTLCPHVVVLPEAASIIFSGGFQRGNSLAARKGIQRAIYHVQREQERVCEEEQTAAMILCDRGTLDSLAYWPNSEKSFFDELAIKAETEMLRYSTVIHMRTPSLEQGYIHNNPMRIEEPLEAAEIDKRIEKVWDGHPNRWFIESSEDFVEKARKAIALIAKEIPDCCKGHLPHFKI
jgi:predicted ATPase